MDALNAKAPPVEVRNLTKRYKDGTRANRDITLTIARGELLGIVGPNGAGKTTLVRQITTELLPTSGEVRVFGHRRRGASGPGQGTDGRHAAGGQPLL